MRFTLILAVFLIALSSCIGTKRYSRYLNEGYKSSIDTFNLNNPDITFKQNSAIVDTLVTAKNKKSQFIPAIVIWQWEKSISATLPEKHQASKIQSYLERYADSLHLAEKLNGRKLEITIESAPANFIYTNKGFVLYLFVAYVTKMQESIQPEFSDLRLSYKLTNDSEVKKGELTVLDRNEPAKNIWKSTKKFTWKYLSNYENNVRLMSKRSY